MQQDEKLEKLLNDPTVMSYHTLPMAGYMMQEGESDEWADFNTEYPKLTGIYSS